MQAIKIVVIQITIACVALTLLWQSRLVRWEGHRLDQMQSRIANIEAQIHRCEAHISKLKSPQRIMKLVHHLNLNLIHQASDTSAPRPEYYPSLVENNDMNQDDKASN